MGLLAVKYTGIAVFPPAPPPAGTAIAPAGTALASAVWRYNFYRWQLYVDKNIGAVSAGNFSQGTSPAQINTSFFPWNGTDENIANLVHGFEALGGPDQTVLRSAGNDIDFYDQQVRQAMLKSFYYSNPPPVLSTYPPYASALASRKAAQSKFQMLVNTYNTTLCKNFTADWEAWQASSAWQTELDQFNLAVSQERATAWVNSIKGAVLTPLAGAWGNTPMGWFNKVGLVISLVIITVSTAGLGSGAAGAAAAGASAAGASAAGAAAFGTAVGAAVGGAIVGGIGATIGTIEENLTPPALPAVGGIPAPPTPVKTAPGLTPQQAAAVAAAKAGAGAAKSNTALELVGLFFLKTFLS